MPGPEPSPARLPSAKGLSAAFVNTSLERRPAQSHTAKLMKISEDILRQAGASVSHIHFAEHDVAPGIKPDMTDQGWNTDEWPQLWKKIKQADILVVGTPIWLGRESSLCTRLIERLYAMSGELNDKGQSLFYGKVGGAMITGNEDGIKHCAASILFALQHLGYCIPPQADCGWIGEAGPGPSFGDPREGDVAAGFDNEFTQKNTAIMTWNLIHLARMLKDKGGLPNFGNDRQAWDDGERFGLQLPEAYAE